VSGVAVDFLSRAVNSSRARLTEAEHTVPLSKLEERIWELTPTRSLEAAMRDPGRMHVIAEMKKASPSSGKLSRMYKPSAVAEIYRDAGASAVSVLTEPEHFAGELTHLAKAGSAGIPVLREDFLVSPYQVAESRAAGADGIHLIVAALGEVGLRQMLQTANRYGLASLVEAHDEEEIGIAAACGVRIISVNSRDLRTLRVDMKKSLRLAKHLPRDATRVAQSGISRPEQVRELRAAGYDAILVGEALMTTEDPGALLISLMQAGAA
jgi:indole-3-glycerol phosphate synthase